MRLKRLASLLISLSLLSSCNPVGSSGSEESLAPSSEAEESSLSSSFEPVSSSGDEASSSSSSSESSSEAPHEHTYSEAWSSDDGYHWHASTCDHPEAIKDKTPHSFGEWTMGEAGDDGKAIRTRVCSVCGKAEQKSVDCSVNEETWKEALSGRHKNYTIRPSDGETTAKVTIAEDAFYCEYDTGYMTIEVLEEDKLVRYDYNEEFRIWNYKDETPAESLLSQHPEYDDYRDWIYDYYWKYLFNIADIASCYSKMRFDKEKCAMVADSITYVEYGYGQKLRDIEVRFEDGRLVSIGCEKYGMRYTISDIGSSSIDLSVLDHQHTFDQDVWESDKDYHWHPLTCSHKGSEAGIYSSTEGFGKGAHTFDGSTGKCSVCGYACKHDEWFERGSNCLICGFQCQHTPSTDDSYYGYSEDSHCKKYGCGHFNRDTMASHTFVDCVCTVCGYTKHTYSSYWSSDDDYHWHKMTCSHEGTSENPTKVKHRSFEDYCLDCNRLNVAYGKTETVDEAQWNSALASLDVSNLTMYYQSGSGGSVKKIKLDGNYVEATLQGYEDGKITSTTSLRSYEGDKAYDFITDGDGSAIKKETLDTSNDCLYEERNRVSLLESIKSAPFSDFTYKSGGYYLGAVMIDSETEWTVSVAVKFSGGKLSQVSTNYGSYPFKRSGEFAFFYAFGSTEADVPSDYKQYDFTGKYGPVSGDSHSHLPVFKCGEEEKLSSCGDYAMRCTYVHDHADVYLCSICHGQCLHSYSYSHPAVCSYCGYTHAHQPGEYDVCEICGYVVTDQVLINDLAYEGYRAMMESQSFAVSYEEYEKNEEGEFELKSSGEERYSDSAIKKSESLYYVKEGDAWASYARSADGEGNSVWDKETPYFYYDPFKSDRSWMSRYFSSDYAYFARKGENALYRASSSRDASIFDTTIVFEDGVLASCSYWEVTSRDENGEITGKRKVTCSGFNATSVDLPDFGD